MNKDDHTVKLHSKGGRLYVNLADIVASEQGRQVLARFKASSICQSIKQREGKSPSAA
jgi:hypothetical protein